SGRVLIGVPTNKGIVHIPAEMKHSRLFGANGMELGCEFTQPLPPGNPLPPPPAVASAQLEEVHRTVMEILGTSQGQHLPSHERRVHPRVFFNESITIGLDRRCEPVVCYARDLSKGGISFLAQEVPPPEITISFAPSSNRPTLTVRSKVVCCARIKEGFYDVGAVFLHADDKIRS